MALDEMEGLKGPIPGDAVRKGHVLEVFFDDGPPDGFMSTPVHPGYSSKIRAYDAYLKSERWRTDPALRDYDD